MLPKPLPEAMIYEDNKLYCCLANFPIVKGHVVIVWKTPVKDLHLLAEGDYDYLMDKVDEVRNAMLKALSVEKVYLIYMDEANQVHWHLAPRYNERGFNMLAHEPQELKDFSLAGRIKEKLVLNISS